MENNNIDLNEIPIRLTIEIGCVDVSLHDLKTYGEGSVVTLNELAGEHVLVKANGEPIGLAEVVVVDENFAVRIVEILDEAKRKQYKNRKDIVSCGKIVKQKADEDNTEY